MHRVRLPGKKNRAAALFIHGLFDSADSWVMNTRDKSHVFVMADAGYDVYVANNRGNMHSRGHINLDPKNDKEYWDNAYSVYIAKYDLPAFMEKVKLES